MEKEKEKIDSENFNDKKISKITEFYKLLGIEIIEVKKKVFSEQIFTNYKDLVKHYDFLMMCNLYYKVTPLLDTVEKNIVELENEIILEKDPNNGKIIITLNIKNFKSTLRFFYEYLKLSNTSIKLEFGYLLINNDDSEFGEYYHELFFSIHNKKLKGQQLMLYLLNIIKKNYNCMYCKKVSKNCKQCSNCKKVIYCSVECQKLDWEKNHKKICTNKIY